MLDDVVIRPAETEELDKVENLVKAAYREFQPLMPETAWQRWMDNITETLHDSGGIVLVADHEGRIEGAVTFYPDAGQAHQGHWPAGAGAMRLLAVNPGRRGRGYGLRLTEACLERARESQVHTIFLYTGTFMTAAQHLYEKLGFKRVPEFDRPPGPIAYRLEL
jgi:ribosomal protein S18 acetylase RimI-like enzyme